MIKLEITAAAVAWYGAIIGTTSAAVSFLNAWRDRARIRMSISPNMSMGDEKRYLVVTVVNCGRRPTTVSHVAGGPNRWMIGFCLEDSIDPKELTEGREARYILRQDQIDFSTVKYLSILSSTGKRYVIRIKKKVLKQLLEQQELSDKTKEKEQ